MKTPVCDFADSYAGKDALRLHMPGHKGKAGLGPEPYDITEINGADSLYEAAGILRESEANASALFGCRTFYSAEGSSLCIRAMLWLVCLYAKQTGRKPLITAGRNAHKAFLNTAAVLDLEVDWLYPSDFSSYLSCRISAEALEAHLSSLPELPAAVYITSPDYTGEIADIAALARVCRRYDLLLLTDNAHGAYLKFLSSSRHPIDLGAHLCCDSAHKTLPVLTGGAYLHLSEELPALFTAEAKHALAVFGSSSPSYLILESLDAANAYLETYPARLSAFLKEADGLRQRLTELGYGLHGREPLKLTIRAKTYGYTGTELSRLLEKENICCEFADPDFLVMMLTPEIGPEGLARLETALSSIKKRTPLSETPPRACRPTAALSPRQALWAEREEIPAQESLGRIFADAALGCPPAVPILMYGEVITEETLRQFRYYGITSCTVVKQ